MYYHEYVNVEQRKCREGEEGTGWEEFFPTVNYFYPKARQFGNIFLLIRKQGHQSSNLIRGLLTMPSCSLRAHFWGEKVEVYIFSCCVLKVLLFEEILKKGIFLKVWCMHSFTSFNKTALTWRLYQITLNNIQQMSRRNLNCLQIIFPCDILLLFPQLQWSSSLYSASEECVFFYYCLNNFGRPLWL